MTAVPAADTIQCTLGAASAQTFTPTVTVNGVGIGQTDAGATFTYDFRFDSVSPNIGMLLKSLRNDYLHVKIIKVILYRNMVMLIVNVQ